MRFGHSWAFNFIDLKRRGKREQKIFYQYRIRCHFTLQPAAGSLRPGLQPDNQSSGELPTLKIAVLPILDALPMYVANDQGLFEKQGVKVELIPAASAAERDQLIAAGQADGMINEIVSTILYNKDQIQVQIVRFARVATRRFGDVPHPGCQRQQYQHCK